MNNKIKSCKDCLLHVNDGPVLGYGSDDADVMFIADAPEPREARAGIPFIGKAKDRMVKAIADNGLKKGEYYFTYLIKHSLGDKKTIEQDHKSQCFKILLEEIELVNPRIIVSMGIYVTKMLIKHYGLEELEMAELGKIHGNGYIIPEIMKHKKIIRPKRYLIPTWSPCISDYMMNGYFKDDVQTVKWVRNLGILLFN